MEIEQLRKEFNQILDNINEHSARFTEKPYLPLLEVNVMMAKINKLQETAAILKYLLINKDEKRRQLEKIEEKTPIIATVNEPKEKIVNPTVALVAQEEEKPIIETLTPVYQSEIIHKKVIEHNPPLTESKSVSDKFLHAPISSLKDAFSLNDRYLFANELFKKDMTLFNETIKNIDACKSIDEAQDLLSKSKTALNWDDENERVINFYELVERRFL